MAVIAPLAIAALSWVSVEGRSTAAPWAENQELSSCAAGNTCAIRSSWEVVSRSARDARPSDASLRAPEELDRSVLGRRFSVLEDWNRPEGSGFVAGNELGDQVLQEVPHGTSSENRNPVTIVRLATPDSFAIQAFARLEQVDHFSDAGLPERSALLGNPKLGSPWPEDRFAWFGENLPPYSLAGGGASFGRGDFFAAVSGSQGWVWQHLPISDRLVPWKATVLESSMRWRNLNWTHRQQILSDLSDSGRVEERSGTASWRLNSPQILELGIRYRSGSARGAFERKAFEAGPWSRHSFKDGSWRWAGFHRVDGESHLLRDTLAWMDDLDGLQAGIELAVQASDRPDGTRPEVESALLGESVATPEREEWSGSAHLSLARDLGTLHLEGICTPSLVVSPRAHSVDSVPSSAMRRREIALSGNLPALSQRVELGWRPRQELSMELAGSLHRSWGALADRIDVSLPAWSAEASMSGRTRSGLSLRGHLGVSASSTIRNLHREDVRTGRRWTLDCWVGQILFRDRLTLSLALLDLLADDRSDLPEEGQRRPRLLVSALWSR